MRLPPPITTVALLAATLLVPPSSAWEIPQGTPYTGDESILISAQFTRTGLTFRSGLLAWSQADFYNASADWRQARIVYTSVDGQRHGNLNASSGDSIPYGEPAYAPALSASHLAWIYHANSTGTGTWSSPYAGNEIYAMSLATHRVERLGGNATTQVSAPHLQGPTLVWTQAPANQAANPVVHRVNLTTARHESWTSPLGWDSDNPMCEMPAWPVGSRILLKQDPVCLYGNHTGGLFLWTPGTDEARLVTADSPDELTLDGSRIAWTAYRDLPGSKWNVYTADLAAPVEARVTLLPHETVYHPALSGQLLSWTDLRSAGPAQCQGGACAVAAAVNVYFKDLRTANEYKLDNSFGSWSGSALNGRDLAFNDADGRLKLVRLPSTDRLLIAGVLSGLARAGGPVPGNALDLSLVAGARIDQSWDANLDGVFESNGPLSVPFNATGQVNLTDVVGLAVAGDGRYSLVTVNIAEKLDSVLHPRNGGPTTKIIASGPTPAGSERSPGVPGVGFWATLIVVAGVVLLRRH